MASLGRVTTVLAGLTAAGAIAGAAHAQPIVSPRQLATPAPSSPAPRSAPSKPAAAKPGSRKAAVARPASAKPASAAAATTRGKAGATTSTAAKAKAKAKTKASTPRSKSAAKAPGTQSKSRMAKPRAVAVASGRARRGDNMPVGFAWPPSEAMIAAETACKADLAALGVDWRPGAPEGRIAAPVELTSTTVAGVVYAAKWRRPPHTLDCHLARALAHVGPALYAIGVREVRFGSIFRWTNVRTGGQELPFLSRHALGLAMDIVEFIDDTGRVANVEQHYRFDDPLLLAIEEAFNASGKFRIVLTPRNDPASHHDHFHIEANPSYTAR